jgi:hypothetical protein
MNDDKGSSCDEPKLLSLAIIQRAASLDSAEANAAKAAAALCAAGPPPRLERHTYHSPPGAFAMSTSGRHGIVPLSRSRTYSDETDRSTVSSTRDDDYLVAAESQQQPPLHRVPIAELVPTQQPQVLETTNVNDDNCRQRIWDLEIAQEVYGGTVVVTTKPPEEDGIMSPGQRRLWLRAFFLACVMVFLLLTAVGVTRSLEQKRKGPLQSSSNNSGSGNKPTVPVSSTNGSLNYTDEELLLHETEEEEQEEHHEASFEADLIAETTNGTFISCPNQNTTHVAEDLRLAICDVADVWEDELEATFQNNHETTLDLSTLWPVSCNANVTRMVCTTIRNLICTSLQTGLLPTDPFNHTMTTTTTTTTDYSSTPRSVTNPSSSSHPGGGSSASSHSNST